MLHSDILKNVSIKEEQGIVMLIFLDSPKDKETDIALSESVIKKIKEIVKTKNSNKKLLIDLTRLKSIGSMPSRSRKNYVELGKGHLFKKVAIAGGNIHIRTITSFIIRATGRMKYFKCFSSSSEALNWLKKN